MTVWHAAPDTLARYATAPDTLDETEASSLEAHLLACDECRRAVASALEPGMLADSWTAVADRIDQSRLSLVERALRRFLPDDIARVVAATPALRVSWLAAVAAVVAAAVAAGRVAGTDTPFLALAPLVPLAGVAASFWSSSDPAGETALATPLFGAGLLLRRTAAVLATSVLVLTAGALALPGLEVRDAGWVLPAVGLTLGALALSTWVAPGTATVTIAAAWVVVIETTVVVDGPARALSDSVLFGAGGQVTFSTLIVLAAAAVRLRRSQLTPLVAT